jgi:hypothetical protein
MLKLQLGSSENTTNILQIRETVRIAKKLDFPFSSDSLINTYLIPKSFVDMWRS